MTDTGPAIPPGPVSQSHHGFMSEWKSYRRQPVVIAAAAAFTACVIFWAIGLSGGFSFLHRETDPMAALLGLYAMLAAVAASIVVAVGAATYLARTVPKRVRR